MESIKINIKNPVIGINEIDFSSATLNIDGNITIVHNGTNSLQVGDNLTFRRYIYGENKNADIINSQVEVLELNDTEIIISQPEKELYEIYNSFSANTLPDKIIVKLSKNHNIFLQDLDKQRLYFYDYKGKRIDGEYKISIPHKRQDIEVSSAYCITNSYIIEECNECNNEIKVEEYTHTPECFSRNSIIVSISKIPTNAVYVGFKYNSFYYNNNDKCSLWTDTIWGTYHGLNSNCNKYINTGESRVILCKDESYWNVGFGLSSDSDESKLGSEDSFGESFIYDIIEDNIPEIIDMERLKYSPMIKNGGEYSIATSITMNFHFRERDENNDAWNIDLENESNIFWNGFNNSSGTTFNKDDFKDFIENSGNTSDPIGYLNFTDDDIFYRKKKVSKSFIRLSFYSSMDPIEQKLLYYSTIFLDGGELYGKYIKQLLNIKDNKAKPYDNENFKVVKSTNGTPVSSQIIITNEFDYNKSSEGFNIYLFNEDKTLESMEKTIYMKIEFNHAGNGKTIPLMMWPQDNNGYKALTIDNFIESLYIPIKLSYIDNKYVYYIPSAKNNDGDINIILFEPKLFQD